MAASDVAVDPDHDPITFALTTAPAGMTKVNWWHSMGGDLGGKAIPQMVDDFNKSQNKFQDPAKLRRLLVDLTSSLA